MLRFHLTRNHHERYRATWLYFFHPCTIHSVICRRIRVSGRVLGLVFGDFACVGEGGLAAAVAEEEEEEGEEENSAGERADYGAGYGAAREA